MGPQTLTRRDWCALLLLAAVVCGVSVWSGRVLTMHESRLAETAREMYATGDWLVPQCGGRPWLERPPLPHWITVGLAACLGQCDQAWIIRLPASLMGVLCAALVAWQAASWYGRRIGLLSGAILLTSCQFLRYTWLAEEDIFLAAIVLATMVAYFRSVAADTPDVRFWGRRPASVLWFFALLGATNMVKGLLFGAALALSAIFAEILWSRDWSRIRRYLWGWGWLAAAVTSFTWIALASWRHPDLLQLWVADVVTRTDGISRRDPLWYYPVTLAWNLLPWTFPAIYGLWLTCRESSRTSRLLAAWSIVPITLLSLAHHKHHHYLVPCLAPWAILSARGAEQVWLAFSAWPRIWKNPAWGTLAVGVPASVALWIFRDQIPGPAWLVPMTAASLVLSLAALIWACGCPHPQRAGLTLFSCVAAWYVAGHLYAGQYIDLYRADTEFLQQSRQIAGDERPIYINGQGAILNMFRHLFYLGDQGRMLHNLTFLRDDAIQEPEILLIARYRDQQALTEFGAAEVVLESPYHEKKRAADTRWTLFRVRLRSDLDRFKNEATFTAKQVMEREPGPYLGPPPTVLSAARDGETVHR